jgi:hypothetical protein
VLTGIKDSVTLPGRERGRGINSEKFLPAILQEVCRRHYYGG